MDPVEPPKQQVVAGRPCHGERAPRTAESPQAFEELLRLSQSQSDRFWAEVASEFDWLRTWDCVQKGDMPDFEFFSGGVTNPCLNLLDRHVRSGAGRRTALIWEREDGSTRRYTYRSLLLQVCRFANVLKSLGVQPGDPVAIFLPNVPECFIAILACFRLGAIYNTVFSGFSAAALNDRLERFEPKVIVTADFALRRGAQVPLKEKVDACLPNLASVRKVIVVSRTRGKISFDRARDLWWHEAMRGASAECPAEPLEANAPGLVFYTSGTTGKPKGVVHSGTGFVINNYVHAKYQMDHAPGDILWCTADVGWLTMHIWGIAGALTNGVTTLVTEGALDYPDLERFFRIVHRHRVNKVFTAPTAVRMLMRADESWRERWDATCVEVVGLVGEPLNPEAWHWLHSELGTGQVYVNNVWGQTELAGCPLAGAAWFTPMKPGSCGKEFLGQSVDILDDNGLPVAPGVPGHLVVKKPFPMMARTLWKDHPRYLAEYFERFPGFYASSDSAVRDEEGYYWVLGRLDDVINVAGHRLSTMEIENAILTCPDVSEAAVVGCPSEIKGMVPATFLRLKHRRADHGDLIRAVREAVEREIGKIASPEHVIVVDALPKTSSGKIMRRLLRELLVTGEVNGDVSGLEDGVAVQAIQAALRMEYPRTTSPDRAPEDSARRAWNQANSAS